jgi:hypothetical protein
MAERMYGVKYGVQYIKPQEPRTLNRAPVRSGLFLDVDVHFGDSHFLYPKVPSISINFNYKFGSLVPI